jgi:aspartate oxidase
MLVCPTAAVVAAAAAAAAVPQWLAPEKLRGCGAILLNSKGQRFVDELTTRDKVTDAIMQQVNTACDIILEP